MSNRNWYYRVNLETKEIIDYMQVPDVWRNCSGLSSSDEATLADMNWAGHNEGFLTKDAAITLGVSASEFTRTDNLVTEVNKEVVRKKRNILLAQSDKAVLLDRWSTYSDTKKAGITEYRQTLRDITASVNINNITWPALPEGLEYLAEYQ